MEMNYGKQLKSIQGSEKLRKLNKYIILGGAIVIILLTPIKKECASDGEEFCETKWDEGINEHYINQEMNLEDTKEKFNIDLTSIEVGNENKGTFNYTWNIEWNTLKRECKWISSAPLIIRNNLKKVIIPEIPSWYRYCEYTIKWEEPLYLYKVKVKIFGDRSSEKMGMQKCKRISIFQMVWNEINKYT